ncbi:MAG: imidazoleglycerol-phosphate dehydratase [Planctomycetes bacterium]|nr:imidazoleglycerol-phosphate dehydratase [Planctomycetota bacterium]
MRKKRIARRSRETDVAVSLELDGGGRSDVSLPDRWLRHMIESLAKFAGFDVKVRAQGDFAHHVNEDLAITLGRALRGALRDRPVRRVGSATVPMDDALVTVAVDLVDRPYCEADLPDAMLAHFLRSFAMEARITLHAVVVRGKDFHHVNEACFKALGLALREATRPAEGLRSTKGAVRWNRR